MNITMRVLTILFGLLVSGVILAKPVVEVNYEHYWVHPRGKNGIEREIRKNSPVYFEGKTYAASTKWNVQWKYNSKMHKGNCKITDITTRVLVSHTMPKIPRRYSVGYEMENRFDYYYQILLDHEIWHRKSGLLAAEAIEKLLMNYERVTDCKKLEANANRDARNIIRKYDKRDIYYDRKTKNSRR